MTQLRWLVLLAVGMVGIMDAPAQDKAEPPGEKPLLTMHGRNSKITKRKLLRITTPEEWRALWMEHKTGSAKREVVPKGLEHAELDFGKVMVLAVFEGQAGCC